MNKNVMDLFTALLLLIVAGTEFLPSGSPASNDLKAGTAQKYIFYLHGRIVEIQGAEAVSPEYGKYHYRDIVKALSETGARVISEVRPEDADPADYARKVAAQIRELLEKGVPAGSIMVVGASKGAGIAVLVSDMLRNRELKFVLLAICSSQMADYWKENGVELWGKVLYIYDHLDKIAGSCRQFPEILKSPGLARYREIELRLGLGHGALYAPYREWIEPALQLLEQKP